MVSRVGIQWARQRLLMDARWNGRLKSVHSSKRLGGRHPRKHELAADYPSSNPSNLRILFPFTCQFCLAAPDSSFRLDLQKISSRASLATHVPASHVFAILGYNSKSAPALPLLLSVYGNRGPVTNAPSNPRQDIHGVVDKILVTAL